MREVHTAPLVSVWCWYRVGSKDEHSGLTGVSHWCEHMNFKGTKNIPRDRVKGIIDQYGGFWNGYTWIDQTTYMETATTDALDDMLFIEAERMSGCLYDPADCESERTVIISELQGNENDPDQLLDTEVTATALQAHPYRHPTIGWLADLQAMTRDDLYGYYRQHYLRTTRPSSSSAMWKATTYCAGPSVRSGESRPAASYPVVERPSRPSWGSAGSWSGAMVRPPT